MEKIDILTATFMGVAAIIIIAFDIWTAWKKGTESTISWTTLIWSARHPILTLILGILIGHLVVPQYLPCADQKQHSLFKSKNVGPPDVNSSK